MADVIRLIKGEVYYRALFYDKKLSLPCIETYVYEGFDDEHGYLFINAAGHMSEKRAFLCCELLELSSGFDFKERGGRKVRLRWLGLMLKRLLLNIRAAASHGALLDVVAFWILEKPKKCWVQELKGGKYELRCVHRSATSNQQLQATQKPRA